MKRGRFRLGAVAFSGLIWLATVSRKAMPSV
jgi:hypothetical protein